MGQKTNPNILRLGKTKEWNSKYIEKKTAESSFMILTDLEIRRFIFQIFEKQGLNVENCKTYYSERSLHIYVSYYNSIRPIITESIRIQSKKKKSTSFKTKVTRVKKATTLKQLYVAKAYNKSLVKKETQLKKIYFLNKKTQRIKSLTDFKSCIDAKNNKTLDKQALNQFTAKILKSLSLFLGEKQNIFLNLKQVNSEISLLKQISKNDKQKLGETLVKLRKFQQNEFFKKSFTLLYKFVTGNQSPQFLANFIASYLRKLKRPNFFLRFVKILLTTFIVQNFSKLERIQIKIKGRFNGAPRSTHKFINVGKNVPVLTLTSKINYGESTAYTSNGTFGIKIWTYRNTL
jgi:ribosomal protein S3